MIESSKDILYLVIAFCVLWVTVFLCWMLYYVMKILKNASQIIEEFRSRLQVLTEAIDYLRGKVENIHALLSVASGGVAGAVKSMVASKAKEWMDVGSQRASKAAKEAVEKAVEATTKKMKKTTRNLQK